MQTKIVIDTNIWVKAILNEEYTIECDDALSCFLQNEDMILALDYQREIEREYRDNITGNRRFELNMKRLDREQRKCWVNSKLIEKQETDLYNLKFQEKEDHVFVGTAMNADRVLVTEDSFF